MPQGIGHLSNAISTIGCDACIWNKTLPNRSGLERGIEVAPALTREICLDPPVILGLSQQVSIVSGVTDGGAGRNVTDNLGWLHEHRAYQILR